MKILKYKNYLILKILLVALVIVTAQIIQLYRIGQLSPNYDEIKYLTASKNLAKNLDWDQVYERLHPPMMYYLANLYSNYAPVNDASSQLFWARFPFILLFPFFALTVFLIAKSTYGFLAGFLSLILFSFNPEILAHSRFLTPDFLNSFGFLLTVFLFSRFVTKKSLPLTIICGLSLGFALLTKYTTLILLPFFVIYWLLATKSAPFLKSFINLVVVFAIAIFILNLGYLFRGSLQIPKYFESWLWSGLSHTPLRLLLYSMPKPFLLGLDLQFVTSNNGWWGWFWGMQYMRSPWYVLPMSFVIKTPIPLLILIVFAFILFLKKEFVIKSQTEKIFLFFIIIFVWYMSFINHIAIGLRYLLPIYPFVIILVSKVVTYRPRSLALSNVYRMFMISLVIWYFVKTLLISPHFLEYTNEAFGGPNNAYKYFVDSSLDWGQNNFYLESYRKSHPNAIIEPQWPMGGTIVTGSTVGTIVVGVNDFNLWKAGTFDWLRQIYKKPSGTIGYTWLIFTVTQKDLER